VSTGDPAPGRRGRAGTLPAVGNLILSRCPGFPPLRHRN
jgi:hypothetical protein